MSSLFKRIKRIQSRISETADNESATSSGPRRPSSADFSLRASPLTRVMATQIGLGQPAKLLQQVTSAASPEAGGKVSASLSAPWDNFVVSVSLSLERLGTSLAD